MRLFLTLFLVLISYISLEGKDPAKEETAMIQMLKKAGNVKYSDWQMAKTYLDQAEAVAQNSKNEELKARFSFEAANIYYDRDIFDISLKYTLEAYQYYQKRNPEKALECQNLLAIIYARMNNRAEALKHFRNYYHAIRDKNPDLSAKALNNIGSLYVNSGKTDSAFYYFRKSRALLAHSHNANLILNVNANLARTLAKAGKNEAAEKQFLYAVSLLKEVKDSASYGMVYNELALFYLNTQRPQLAVRYAELARQYSKVKYSFQNSNILKTLYTAYLADDNPRKAATYFQIYDEVRDSLNIEEKAVNIERDKIQSAFESREHELQLLNNQRRLKLSIAILILLIFTGILGFFLLRYRSNLEKEKLEKALSQSRENELELALELRNKELVSKSILENERAGMYEDVIKDLKKLKDQGNHDDLQKELSSMIFRISKNPGKPSWEEFNLRFNNVYDSFYEKLHRLHPSLSHHDKRLCAFIKLNLTSKEIADITKTSVKSVENSRTRLRKNWD